MKLLPLSCALLISVGVEVAHAQPPAPGPRQFSVERLDPALDAIISPDAKLELLADRFGLTEGPVWVPEGKSGYLLLSDLIENVIYKRDSAGKVTVFLDKAGYSGDDLQNAGTQTKRGRAAVLMTAPARCWPTSSRGSDSTALTTWCRCRTARSSSRTAISACGAAG